MKIKHDVMYQYLGRNHVFYLKKMISWYKSKKKLVLNPQILKRNTPLLLWNMLDLTLINSIEGVWSLCMKRLMILTIDRN